MSFPVICDELQKNSTLFINNKQYQVKKQQRQHDTQF